MSFEQDVYDWSSNIINRLGYKENTNPFVTLANVFTLSRMFISTKERKVYLADNLDFPMKYKGVIEKIVHDLSVGNNVNTRLSRKIKDKKVYTDRMLADWGIHHLHLGEELISKGKNKGLIEGNKEILFVYITNDEAYLIGVFNHDSWTKTKVLEIVHDNWYHLLEPFEIPRDFKLSRDIPDSERLRLRNANINTATPVRGFLYMGLGGGLTCGNLGGHDAHKANTVLRASDELNTWVKSNFQTIEYYFSGTGINFANERLEFQVSKYVISGMYTILCNPSKYSIHIPSNYAPCTLVPHGFEVIIEPSIEKREINDHRPIKEMLIECG